MKCNNCGAIIEEGEKFCNNCGAIIVGKSISESNGVHIMREKEVDRFGDKDIKNDGGFVVCEHCGSKLPYGSKICEECGSIVSDKFGSAPFGDNSDKHDNMNPFYRLIEFFNISSHKGIVISISIVFITVLVVCAIMNMIFKSTYRPIADINTTDENKYSFSDSQDAYTSIPTATNSPTDRPKEKPSSTPYVTHTYEVVISKVTWDISRQQAENQGGHLVTINNQAEFDTLKDILSSSEYENIKNVWIGACAPVGLNSASAAQEYWSSPQAEWITGEAFEFYQWRNGEPSGYDANLDESERYIQIFRPKADNYQWSFNDAGNNLSQYKDGSLAYIIEYEGNT